MALALQTNRLSFVERPPMRVRRVIDRLERHRIVFSVSGAAVALAALVSGMTDVAVVPKTAGLSLPPIAEAAAPSSNLLIFIHGWNGDKEGTWKRFPDLARGDKRLHGYAIWSLDYTTYITRRNIGIARVASFFNDEFENVRGIYDRYDNNIVIIAHSMGGLVARELLIQRRLRNLSNEKRKILIEIATPHAGANQARLLRMLGLSRRFADSMETDFR
ncbi:MAG TPA: alpha/beta fold hydrolase [Thermoanaerobaculia bacterium]|nr:alpha/beta fold hydrolase [Thermoanaerobaculia bacterium]